MNELQYGFGEVNVVIKERKGYEFLKRSIDVVGALCGLILLSPILLVIMVLIKLESKGPVIFSQDRVGKYGKKFKMYKFRSMVVNAEELKKKLAEQNEMSGPMFKMKDDPRVTKIGKFIRKCRLDEVSQLIDVFRGTMTFVGTRPEAVKYVDAYTPEMMATLLLPAGVTSMASIYYKDEAELLDKAEDAEKTYVEEVVPAKMKYNLREIEKFSFWRDIKVMFMTVFAVLGKEYKEEK